MPEERRPGLSSAGVAFEQIDSPPIQSRESTEEEPRREVASQAAKEQLTVETSRRRARKAARPLRARPMGAPIGGPASEIVEHAEEESDGPTAVRTSAEIAPRPVRKLGPREASAEQSAARKETVATEIVSPAWLRSPDAISSPVPVTRAAYAVAKVPAEIRGTVSAESSSPAPWELELRARNSPQRTTELTVATWRDALWEALHGRWSEAGWEFARGVFHLFTQAATWRRVGKAVLNFLARFIPGREPEVLRRSREIKELFRNCHEEPKQPGTWSNCAR